MPDVVEVATDVAGRLEALAIPYLISGSLASSVHGEPRATMDVDLVADLRPEQVEHLAAALRPEYYVDEDVMREATRTGGSFNAVHTRAGVKVDVFVAGEDPFEQARLRSRIAVAVTRAPSPPLWFDTAEHTLLRKLEWYRRGGEVSERQWRDVQAIIALQGASLDHAVLTHWAAALGVEDLLRRAWGTAR